VRARIQVITLPDFVTAVAVNSEQAGSIVGSRVFAETKSQPFHPNESRGVVHRSV
jgi:hypothetical protein